MPENHRQKPPKRSSDPPAPTHIADESVNDAGALDSGVKSPTTETGLPVEEQVRKEWDPKKSGGLPTGLQRGRR